MRRASILFVVLLASAVGCGGGGGGGGGNVTAPRPLAMEMLVRNSAGGSTLQTVGLFFDGVRLGTATTGASSLSPPMHATIGDVAPGHHTIAAAIEGQTQSPSPYVLSGTLNYQGRTIDVASAATSTATGGTVTVEVDL